MSKKKTLFDYLGIVTHSKQVLDKSDLRSYPTYMINHGLSQSLDTIMYAELMNKPNIIAHWNYCFYVGALPSKKMYTKWAKKSSDDSNVIELIQQVYKVSRSQAVEMAEFVTDDAIKEMKSKLFTGGVIK